MNKDWSKWVLYGWLAFGALGLALELIGLRNDEDSLPPLTTILVHTVRDHPWVAIAVLGFPVWIFIHFARRIW